MQQLLRAGVRPGAAALRAGERDPRRSRAPRRGGRRDPRRCGAEAGSRPRRLDGGGAAAEEARGQSQRGRHRRARSAAERSRAGDPVLRQGVRGRAWAVDATCGDAEEPDRPRARRKGVGRIRQSLRRRPDRVHRIFLGLRSDAQLRRPADARHRLSLQAVPAAQGEDRPGRHPSGKSRPPGAARRRCGRRRGRDARGAPAQA